MNEYKSNCHVWVDNQAILSAVMNDAPLAPFISIKNIIAVIAPPPQIPPNHFM